MYQNKQAPAHQSNQIKEPESAAVPLLTALGDDGNDVVETSQKLISILAKFRCSRNTKVMASPISHSG
ncbi:hypothetical protein JTE90_023254 [Oedothorax gibbosus]|uniref:Uncharacterized protein n=1 Tax=Oedothorax gibbosus TaxID=931172 RepID=A0AAV6U424_9ARAC|nr:hypothetical protein JTE90_023254 [Oedothorax gibbosus]